MIDQVERVTELVAKELQKISLGEDVGYAVSQSFAPVQTGPQIQMLISWIITVSMRSPLLGMDHLSYNAILPCQPGHFPPDKAFAETTKLAMDGVRKLYDEVLSQSKDQIKQIPGVVMGK